MHVEALHFRAIQRASAAATEDSHLVARFIDSAVPVDAFGNGKCGTLCVRGRNQFWRRPRAEA
jgi:hypothetical protein